MCPSDHQIRQTLQNFSTNLRRRSIAAGRYAALLLLLPLMLAGACESPQPATTTQTGLCGDDGQLTVDLFGGLRVSLDWRADVLECDGMPRPNSEGARLRFAGPAQSGSAKHSLAFILAMPDLRRGETDTELPTNVTMMEEGTGRFFATQDTENCWSDIGYHERVGHMDETEYRVSGVVYCLAPLAELNGKGSVSFSEMKFTGRLKWKTPE